MIPTLSSLITEGHALARVKARSKKHALEILAEMLSEALPPDPEGGDHLALTNAVMEALVIREKLGSTGLGSGIALPHASLPTLEKMVGAVITLQQPVDYETPDGEPVDVIMALIAPNPALDEHREMLALTSEVLASHAGNCPLRAARNSAELHAAIECVDKAMSAVSQQSAVNDAG
jgi:PTS system nitrogen regulatory IIA component